MMVNWNSFYVLLIFTLILSCNKKLVENTSTLSNQNKPVESSVHEIVFLYFEMERKQDDLETIQLLKSQTVEGMLKENSFINEPEVDGNLIVQFLDNQQHLIEERIIKNPLLKQLERYDGDAMDHHEIQEEKGEFFLRYNQSMRIETIQIQKLDSGKRITIYTKKNIQS